MKLIVIESGSHGNCAAIEADNGAALILDCGISARSALNLLAEFGITRERIMGVLLSHEHGDHSKGVPKLITETGAHLVTMPETAKRIGMLPFEPQTNICGISVRMFPVPHDAADPVGFVIQCDGKKVGYLVDCGYVSKLMLRELEGVELLMVEANHDAEMLEMSAEKHISVRHRVKGGHGHLSNEAAGQLIQSLRPKVAMLCHLSRDSNTPERALATVESMAQGVFAMTAKYGTTATV